MHFQYHKCKPNGIFAIRKLVVFGTLCTALRKCHANLRDTKAISILRWGKETIFRFRAHRKPHSSSKHQANIYGICGEVSEGPPHFQSWYSCWGPFRGLYCSLFWTFRGKLWDSNTSRDTSFKGSLEGTYLSSQRFWLLLNIDFKNAFSSINSDLSTSSQADRICQLGYYRKVFFFFWMRSRFLWESAKR